MSAPSFKGISVPDLAGAVCAHLESEGIDAVLVGGSVITVYTDNRYVSHDLDIVTSANGMRLAEAMKKIGFGVADGRYLSHPDTDLMVEFLNTPVAIGGDHNIKPAKMRTPFGSFKLVSPLDIIKDRLLWKQHYGDAQALEQAVMVHHSKRPDISGLEKWALREGAQEAVKAFLERVAE